MASKYYAVKKGKVPGIYFNWNDCKAMVDGYQGAVYKSFKTKRQKNLLTERKLLP
jgi:viroplasmin and RNaseH domain-containing protein